MSEETLEDKTIGDLLTRLHEIDCRCPVISKLNPSVYDSLTGAGRLIEEELVRRGFNPSDREDMQGYEVEIIGKISAKVTILAQSGEDAHAIAAQLPFPYFLEEVMDNPRSSMLLSELEYSTEVEVIEVDGEGVEYSEDGYRTVMPPLTLNKKEEQ